MGLTTPQLHSRTFLWQDVTVHSLVLRAGYSSEHFFPSTFTYSVESCCSLYCVGSSFLPLPLELIFRLASSFLDFRFRQLHLYSHSGIRPDFASQLEFYYGEQNWYCRIHLVDTVRLPSHFIYSFFLLISTIFIHFSNLFV